MDLFKEIVRLREEGRRGALATIIRRLGSVPRKDHAKMLIRDDGTTLGSVGGGCVEAEVWQQARQVMASGRPSMVSYQMTDDDAENEGLICGGTVEIFVEPIESEPVVVILGAGHLGQAIARLAVEVGFQVVVIDDRESFANSERFPTSSRVVVQPFSRALSDIEIHENSFVLVVTRGHSHDQVALEQAIQTPARYVGMVGSRRKIRILVERLLEKGLSRDLFTRLYAPIGLDIGSESPEEIAVSVIAELIAFRKGVHTRSPKQQFILRVLDSGQDENRREDSRAESKVPGG